MGYDCLVLSPAIDEGVGAGGRRMEQGWGVGGRVERERKRRDETLPSAWSDHHRILLGHFQTRNYTARTYDR